MTLEELLAREAIRKTIAQYTIAGDRRDASLFDDLWTPDALFEFDGFGPLPGYRCDGIGEIHARSATWKPLADLAPGMRGATFVRHNLTTCRIELTGPETAEALTYFIVMTDVGPDHSGTYTDRLQRQGERWLFTHRRVQLDWRNPDGCFPAVPK